jgi:hypothetical protein
MFEFKFQKWFDIFLELIEFPTNFRSSTHLKGFKFNLNENGKSYCAFGSKWVDGHDLA